MYTVDYFIKKFSDPDMKLGTGSIAAGCAYAKCGVEFELNGTIITDEARALSDLFKRHISSVRYTGPYEGLSMAVVDVNDGNHLRYKQKTAGERMLSALADIKQIQEVEKIAGEKIKEKEYELHG